MFRSEHFYEESNMNAIIKSPIQLIVQAMRSLNPPQRSKMVRTLAIASDVMGQRLFAPPSVKGWDGGRAWINTSTMFMRQKTVLYLLTGQRPDGEPWETGGAQFDAMSLVKGQTRDTKDTVTFLLSILLNVDVPNRDRVASLLDYMKTQNNIIQLFC